MSRPNQRPLGLGCYGLLLCLIETAVTIRIELAQQGLNLLLLFLNLGDLGRIGRADLLEGGTQRVACRDGRWRIHDADIAADLCRGGSSDGGSAGDGRGGHGLAEKFHQNCVPTLKEKVFVSSPGCFLITCDISILNGPKGEFQFTPIPADMRGLAESPTNTSR